MIKYLYLALFALWISSTQCIASLILSQGDSFEMEFQITSPPQTLTAQRSQNLGAMLYLSGSAGDTGMTYWYEDSSNEMQFRNTTLDPDPYNVGGGITGLGFGISTPHWQDKQGVFRVVVDQGSLELDRLVISTAISGQYYEQTYAIPEPSSIALLLISGVGVYMERKRFRR